MKWTDPITGKARRKKVKRIVDLGASDAGKSARGLSQSVPFASRSGAKRAKGQSDASAPTPHRGQDDPQLRTKGRFAEPNPTERLIGLWAQDEIGDGPAAPAPRTKNW